MAWKSESKIALVLAIYLLIVGGGAAAFVIVNFPKKDDTSDRYAFLQDNDDNSSSETNDEKKRPTRRAEAEEGEENKEEEQQKWSFLAFSLTLQSNNRGFLLLALFAGVVGSFLHAAQSLSSYVGNAAFKASWTLWYVLRPWIGGILGLAVYFAFRAGLMSGADAADPYGVVAIGLLGGWFSKTTTDKLQEVYDTLFKTKEDKKRKDKLHEAKRPVIKKIEPSPVPTDVNKITIRGENFQKRATIEIDGEELKADFVSETELTVSIDKLPQRPASGTETLIQVKNPEGPVPVSKGFKLLFQ